MNENTNVVRLKPVESSNVAEIGFDKSIGLLVRFRSGKLYRYPEFPAERFSDFATADSFGEYFAREVRKNFEGFPFEDTVAEPRTFGEVAFEAYTLSRGGLAVNGDPTPEWCDLDGGIRTAWERAAEATLAAFEANRSDGAAS